MIHPATHRFFSPIKCCFECEYPSLLYHLPQIINYHIQKEIHQHMKNQIVLFVQFRYVFNPLIAYGQVKFTSLYYY